MSSFNELKSIILSAKHLGYERTANDAELYGFVLDEEFGIKMWWHYIFPGLTAEQIASLENKCKLSFPKVLCDFLMYSNGVNLFSNALCIYGLRENHDRTSKNAYPFSMDLPNIFERPRDACENHLFIGGFNWDGTLIYIDVESEKVYQCTKQTIKPLNEWPSFWDMLLGEAYRIKSLFSDEGKKLDLDAPTSPQPTLPAF